MDEWIDEWIDRWMVAHTDISTNWIEFLKPH